MSLEGIKEYDKIVCSARSKGRMESEIDTQREEGKVGDPLVKINKKFGESKFRKFVEPEEFHLSVSQTSRKSKKGRLFIFKLFRW
jgi:hypothetical protein